MKINLNWMLALFLTLITQLSFAQEKVITGHVIDEGGMPSPGVNIVIKGTTRGAQTNFDGAYEIKASPGDVLVFTFVGFVSTELTVSNSTIINVTMKEDVAALDEVVITGYQKINRKLFTGSAATLKIEDIKLEGVPDISRALQGQVAGVEIENVSGTFGTAPIVRIRGNASINGTNKPLWVVDGVVLEDAVELTNEDITSGDLTTILSSSTAGINPEDVKSFEILKDASATALYGARAMNGVIVITTKKGKTGVPSISYTTGLTHRIKPGYGQFNILNSGSEMSVYQELYEKGWVDIASANSASNHGVLSDMFYRISENELNWGPGGSLNYDYLQRYANANTDWFDVLFKDSYSYTNSISVSSGTDKARFRASLGMLKDEGQTIADGVSNYTASLNADFNLSKKFTLGFKLNGNVRDQQLAASENRKFNAIDGVYERNFDINPFNYALYTSRSITPYDEDGSLQYFRRNYAPFNIINEIQKNSLQLDVTDLTFQTDLNYDITTDFSISTTMQARWYNSKAVQSVHEDSNNAQAYRADNPLIAESNIFLFDDPDAPELPPYSVLPNGGFRKTTENSLTSFYVRNVLNYSHIFNGVHSVSGLLGQEIRSNRRTSDYFDGWGYVFDKGGLILTDPNFIRFLDSRGEDYFDNDETIAKSWGAFINLAYAFDSKYVFNGTFRYDGDNRTGKSKTSRYLPTWNVSGAWNIHNEKFMDNIDWINLLKLKSTYGVSGDNPVNASAGLIVRGAEPLRPQLSDRETSLYIEQLENGELTFEKLYEWNIGLEMSMFKNRVSTEVEYYKRKSKDLLGLVETNGLGGFQYKFGNVGEMELEGIEATLRTVNIQTANFKWSTNINFNFTKNEITKWQSRDRIGDAIGRNGANIVGYPRGALFSIPFAGLNENGEPTFFDQDGNVTQEINLQERDDITSYLKYEGSTTPKGFGGLNNSIQYKNLSLNVGLSYRYGNKIRLDDAFGSSYDDYSSLPGELINRWSLPGDENVTNVPAILTTIGSRNLASNGLNPYAMYNKSDLRVADGDFVRLKNVSLTYNFPNAIIERSWLKNASMTLSAHNLWLLYSDDKLRGVDPEFFQSGGVSLPLTQTYTVTFNFNF